MKKLLTLLSLAGAAISTNAQRLSIKEITDTIVARNPVVRMFDSEIRAMDEAAKGARSWMPPTIGFGQFMTPYNVNLWRKDGDMKGMGSVMLSAEQMFPNKKQLNANESFMKAMSSVPRENKNANLNELVQDAKSFYFRWLILNKKIVVVKENEKILDFMIRNAEIRYKNGLEKISAYYKAKAALGTTKNMQLMYESDIRESRIRLNALMNRYSTIMFDIDTNYVLKDYSNVIFDSTLFYSRRSDLQALDKQIQINNLEAEYERSALRPQFGIRYENMYGFGGQPIQYTLMAMVKIPIASWSSRMNKANIETLKWKSEAIKAQKQMMANEFSGMAYSMLNEYELKKRQIKLYEETIIPALKNNYRTMQLGYEQNTEELFMLYDAWEKLNMTQLEYLDLLSRAFELQVTIDRLTEQR